MAKICIYQTGFSCPWKCLPWLICGVFTVPHNTLLFLEQLLLILQFHFRWLSLADSMSANLGSAYCCFLKWGFICYQPLRVPISIYPCFRSLDHSTCSPSLEGFQTQCGTGFPWWLGEILASPVFLPLQILPYSLHFVKGTRTRFVYWIWQL